MTSNNFLGVLSFWVFSMNADYVLELYDSFWFKHSIIRGIEYSSSPPSTNVDHQQIVPNEPSDLKLLTIQAMEEMEGFMDLGFVFTEADRRSRLALIVPGLKRMWKGEEDDGDETVIHQRPYLSEMWEFLEWKKKVEKPLDWRISEDTRNNEGSMKDNLKLWAQTVASLAR